MERKQRFTPMKKIGQGAEDFLNAGEATKNTLDTAPAAQPAEEAQQSAPVAKKTVRAPRKPAKKVTAKTVRTNTKNAEPRSLGRTNSSSAKPVVSDEYKWMHVPAGIKTSTPQIARLPQELKLLLNYLGDTMAGQNINSIIVRAVTEECGRLAEERGLPIPDHWGDWIKK